MPNVEFRESARTYGETGPSGDSTREEKVYEIGVTIDGVFVPFASRTAGDLDHARQRQEAAEARGESKPAQSASEPASEPSTAEKDAPTEQQSASEASSTEPQPQ